MNVDHSCVNGTLRPFVIPLPLVFFEMGQAWEDSTYNPHHDWVCPIGKKLNKLEVACTVVPSDRSQLNKGTCESKCCMKDCHPTHCEGIQDKYYDAERCRAPSNQNRMKPKELCASCNPANCANKSNTYIFRSYSHVRGSSN